METLKYKIIKSKTQYRKYCNVLEGLVDSNSKSPASSDEIDLLTLLIQKWDDEHSTLTESDPIQLLRAFMKDHQIKASDLVRMLKVSKGYVSDILNYKKCLSKGIIRELSTYFKVSQEAFNRPYKLKLRANFSSGNNKLRNKTRRLVMAR